MKMISLFILTVSLFAGTLTTQGTGHVTVVPDMANVGVTVQGEHANASDALAIANQKASDLIHAMFTLGIEEKDVATNGLNLYTNHDWQDGRIVRTYFVASHNLTIRVRNLDMVGSVLNKVTQLAGKNSFHLNLDVSDQKAALREALSLAVQDARQKAEIMAGSESRSVVSVVHMESYESQPVYSGSDERTFDVASVTIAPGERTVSAQVRVTFELD